MSKIAKRHQWKQGIYHVKLAASDQLENMERNGCVFENAFGIGRELKGRKSAWIVTHIPTGRRCFFGFATLRGAKAAVMALLHMRSLSRWISLRDPKDIRLTAKENVMLERISARYSTR